MRRHIDAYRGAYLALFSLVFVAALVVSVKQLGLTVSASLALWLALDLLVGAPLAVAIASFHTQACASLVGRYVQFREAFSATAAGVVAEMTPLPGGVIARGVVLIRAGMRFSESGKILFAGSLLGIAIATAAAGLALGEDFIYIGALLFIIGIAITLIIVFGAMKTYDPVSVFFFVITKLAGWCVLAVRILLALMAIGVAARFQDIALFSFAGVFGGVASFAPGGLGVREGLASILAAGVGFSSAAAFTAMAVNRLTGLAFCGAWIAVVFGLRRKSGFLTYLQKNASPKG